VFVSPQVEIPARPDMLPVMWQHNGDLHCLDTDNAKKLLNDFDRLNGHISVLEGILGVVNKQAN
jgi:hypothetical protein